MLRNRWFIAAVWMLGIGSAEGAGPRDFAQGFILQRAGVNNPKQVSSSAVPQNGLREFTATIVENQEQRGLLRLKFAGNVRPTAGTLVHCRHHSFLKNRTIGSLEILGYDGEIAVARVRRGDNVRVAAGDTIAGQYEVTTPPQHQERLATRIAPTPTPAKTMPRAPAESTFAPSWDTSVTTQDQTAEEESNPSERRSVKTTIGDIRESNKTQEGLSNGRQYVYSPNFEPPPEPIVDPSVLQSYR